MGSNFSSLKVSMYKLLAYKCFVELGWNNTMLRPELVLGSTLKHNMKDNSSDLCLDGRKGTIITRSPVTPRNRSKDLCMIVKQSSAHSAVRSDSMQHSTLFEN